MEVRAIRDEDRFLYWPSQLQLGQWVLDVGSGSRKFPASTFRCSVVALDEDTDAFQNAAASRRGGAASDFWTQRFHAVRRGEL